jgi:hypothetical protein
MQDEHITHTEIDRCEQNIEIHGKTKYCKTKVEQIFFVFRIVKFILKWSNIFKIIAQSFIHIPGCCQL